MINRRQSNKNRIVIEADAGDRHFDAELTELEHSTGLTEFNVTEVHIDPDDGVRHSEDECSEAYVNGMAPTFAQAEKIVLSVLRVFVPEAF